MAIVRFAARDPGGANPLASFLSRFEGRSGLTTDIWTLPRATPIFTRKGLSPMEFGESSKKLEFQLAWAESPSDAIITGTSHYAPFEQILWEIARGYDCPSLAVIDQWINLSARFQNHRPDYVGAIDAWQAQELLDLGFAREQVVIVGHPWLAELLESRHDSPEPASDMPQQGALNVLFVSEPISSDVSQGFAQPFGYDEYDSFELVYRAAKRVADGGLSVSLTVKFHAYEEPRGFIDRARELGCSNRLKIDFVSNDRDPHLWVLRSDLVVGISSMLLLEAMVMKKPVVSVQPGLTREDTFIASRRGSALTLTNPVEGEEFLVSLMRDASRRDDILTMNQKFVEALPSDSVSPIAQWIQDMVQR